MRRSDFQLQKLLMDTAQQPDIVYLMVTDERGTILAHSGPAKIGGTYGRAVENRARVLRTNPIILRHKLQKFIFVGLDMGPIEVARGVMS